MMIEAYHQAHHASSRLMLEQNEGDANPTFNERTPSFFQSPSLVCLGGLNICDPYEKVLSMDEVQWHNDQVRNEYMPSNNGFPVTGRESVDSNLGWGGMGLRGNHSYNNLTRTTSGGSGIFIGEDDEKEDEKDNISWGRKMGADHGQKADYIKTSNMANFYYRKGHSHSQGELKIEENNNVHSRRQGRPLSASMKVQSSEG
jgi:hypothetical protein